MNSTSTAVKPASRLLSSLSGTFAYRPAVPAETKMSAAKRYLRNCAILFCCTIVFYYAALSPVFTMDSFYNRILFCPITSRPQSKSIAGVPIQQVSFKTPDGATIAGWYLQAPHAKRTVLFSHGNGGNLDNFVPSIQAAVESGASVLAYDYRGYGVSKGKPSLENVVTDGFAAYDYLVNNLHVNPATIVVYGQSLGTGVSCQIAKQRQVSGLILMSPFTSILDVARELLPWLVIYPDFTFPAQRLESQEYLAGTHPKTLVIHGEADTLVRVHHSADLKKSSSGEMQFLIVPKAGHNDLMGVDGPHITQTVNEFLNK